MWKKIKDYAVHYPVAVAATIFVVLFAVFAAIFGQNIQVGGILDKLWRRQRKNDPDIKLIPPKDRKDDKGIPIPVGESDEKGWVQAPEIEIKKPSIFDSPDNIKIIHPEKGEIEIKLPEGVKNQDVEKIVVIAPNVLEVKNRDKSKVDTKSLAEKLRNLKP